MPTTSRDVQSESMLAPLDIPNTHLVFNQSPVFAGYNAFADDPVLQVLCRGLSPSVRNELEEHGKWAGSLDAM